MKKSLVALAALAVAGVASAQSSVTLFGVVDASISHSTSKSSLVTDPVTLLTNPLAYWGQPASVKTSRTGMANSANSSSRIGFRGVEDLGGGLSASFWLEAALNNDDGNASGFNFQRRSTISLSGNFGEVRLGRDYKPTFWNFTVFDPFGTNGVGTALIQRAAGGMESSNVRANNSIGYFLPKNLGGFYGQVQYAFHEQLKANDINQGLLNNNSRGGKYWGGRFGYANGPLDVAVAYGEQNNASDWTAGVDNTSKNFNLGASYDFGVVKLFGQYAQIKRKDEYTGQASAPAFNPATKMTGYLLGVTAPVGAGVIKATYGHVKLKTDWQANLANIWAVAPATPKADQFALGYQHNLSKRTALYAQVAYIKNKNGAAFSVGSNSIASSFAGAAGGVYQAKSSMGYDLGIRHNF